MVILVGAQLIMLVPSTMLQHESQIVEIWGDVIGINGIDLLAHFLELVLGIADTCYQTVFYLRHGSFPFYCSTVFFLNLSIQRNGRKKKKKEKEELVQAGHIVL
jgi:hypothetical protein